MHDVDHDRHTQEFVHAYLQYSGVLLRYCDRQVSDHAASEDIVQETFLRLWEYLCNHKQVERMSSFLFHVAGNLIIDEWRRRGRWNVSLDALHEHGFDPTHEPIDQTNATIDAQNILDALKLREHRLLHMRYIQGFSLGEIASAIAVTPNVAAVRLHRATRQLADEMLSRSRLRTIRQASLTD